MQINIEQTIGFFDNPRETGHASAIVGLIGEDLNAAAYKHYMENQLGATVAILKDNVTTGKQKGHRLERWIHVSFNGKETLYQCELKSESATAIGGKRLAGDAESDAILKVARHHWQIQLSPKHFGDKGELPNKVTKICSVETFFEHLFV